MLNVVMLSVVVLNVVMRSVIYNPFILIDIILSVVMLNAAAPRDFEIGKRKKIVASSSISRTGLRLDKKIELH